MPSPASLETLTRNFYDWELIGRGWRGYSHLVPLEPPYQPFPGHALASSSIPDDGKRHTFVSAFVERLARQPKTEPEPRPLMDLAPTIVDGRRRYDEVEILVPADQKLDPAVTDAWLRSISAITTPVAFEVVGTGGAVTVRVAASTEDVDLVLGQLRSFFPGVTVRAAERPLAALFASCSGSCVGAVEFGLAHEFMLPLREMPRAPDPLAGLVGALSHAHLTDLAVLQVLFQPARYPWSTSAIEAVTSPDGQPFFIDAPQLTQLAREKFDSPACAVALRVMAVSENEDDAGELIRVVASALSQYSDPGRNALVPVGSDIGEELVSDILLRSTHRSGMILSLSELSSLVRIPGEHVRSPALVRSAEILPQLPSEVLGEGVSIGLARHGSSQVPVRLNEEARIQHTYVIGASGTGKSTLLLSLILQDIERGCGIGLVDPHGDLVDEVLGRMPKERADDVVLLDPSDPDWIVGWNILGAHSDIEKELLASDLVAVFKRLSTSWGDQMSAILGNAVLAFLESTSGGTLSDLRKFLLDDAFRAGFLSTVEDDHVASFWRDEFPLLVGKKPQAPILTRLDTFLRSRLVRSVVTEREKPLNFRAMIDSRAVFLAKLSQGAIGEENAALLGSLIVSKFHQVSLSRQDTASAERKPFFLYLDEFHHFATPSMAGLFSGVRKYRLGLTVAHQDLYQLHQTVPEVERAALTNAYTRILFRVSEEDGRKLERGLGDFTAADLMDLARGEAVVRVGRREQAFRVRTEPVADSASTVLEKNQSDIRSAAMERHGRPRMGVVRGGKVLSQIGAPVETERRARAPEEPAPRRALPTIPEPGRGGAMHKYLQSLIRETGHSQGFRADIEKELADGKRVDVWLEKDGQAIAFEIAGTTTLDQEIGNLRKCLAAGCSFVCAVSLDASFLRRLEKALPEHLGPDERLRVHLLTPEELYAFLAAKTVRDATKRVAGYAVQVRHSSAGASEYADRKRAIAEVMLRSVRRMKERK